MSAIEEQSEEERWLPVVGWEDCYEVSSLGRVRNIRTTGKGNRRHVHVLTPKARAHRGGYLAVMLSRHRASKNGYIHVLVAAAFIGPRPDGLLVCHDDGDVLNNRPSNLRYGTKADNTNDTIRHGTNWMAGRTHCQNGHEFTLDNTGSRGPDNRGRRCLACKRDSYNRSGAVRPEIPEGLLGTKQAGELLGVSRSAIHVFSKQYPDFPEPERIGRLLAFDPDALMAWRGRHPAAMKQAS